MANPIERVLTYGVDKVYGQLQKYPKDIRADLRAATAEFIGMTLFVFAGLSSTVATGSDLTQSNNITGISLTFGFAIVVLVAAIGDISGAHLNPAVTWALTITKNVSTRRGLMYFFSQMLGSVLGAALVRAAYGKAFRGAAGINQVNPVLSAGEGFLVEVLFTFLLVFTVFHVAIHRPQAAGGAALAPLYIGLAVTVAHLGSISVTGCSINPARSFGPALVKNVWTDHWLFWLAPIVGATLAPIAFFMFYKTFKPEDIKLASADTHTLEGVHKVRVDFDAPLQEKNAGYPQSDA